MVVVHEKKKRKRTRFVPYRMKRKTKSRKGRETMVVCSSLPESMVLLLCVWRRLDLPNRHQSFHWMHCCPTCLNSTTWLRVGEVGWKEWRGRAKGKQSVGVGVGEGVKQVLNAAR